MARPETTLLTFTIRLVVFVSLLAAAAADAATGTSHSPVPAGSGCVTPQCHARLLAAAGGTKSGSVHPPAAGGDCVSCHDLGLDPEGRFVKGTPTGDGPESARGWDLELCLGCHGEALAAPGVSRTATGFADGARNLHALHVQAGRGRRCLPCHEPHAAHQPQLLRERIPARGGAQIALQYRNEPNGGWCKTGCHAPKSYRR